MKVTETYNKRPIGGTCRPNGLGDCIGGAYHEHPYPKCGRMTSGVGQSVCPECPVSPKQQIAQAEETK